MGESLPLFAETDLAAIQPTGSVWVLDKDDPATVPVPLAVVIKRVEGPYSERARKLWTFLLHVAFDELGKKGGHSVKISDLNAVFRQFGGQHETEWIWKCAKELAKTTIEFEVTHGDNRYDTITSIFAASVPPKARRGNELHFWFPEPLIPVIKEPLRFARLRVHFLISLSGKYAVTLYEILEAYVNRRDAMCRVTIEDLRRWLKVPDDSYPDWKDFKKRVLAPAVKQINDDPIGAGFTVDYEPIRKGRTYHELIFKLTKTDDRKRKETRLRKADVKSQIRLSEKTEEMARAIASEKGWDYYALREKWFDYAARQTEKGQPPKSPNGAFIAYCRKQKPAR